MTFEAGTVATLLLFESLNNGRVSTEAETLSLFAVNWLGGESQIRYFGLLLSPWLDVSEEGGLPGETGDESDA